MIFDERTLRKLSRLELIASQVRAGMIKGERRSTKRGTSIEFADYRNYTPGDDLRRLDWNIYARLEKPFIKLLEEEEDLAVHLLVDGSRSMDWGIGQSQKFPYALRLAAALGTIALSAGDRLTVMVLNHQEGSGSQPEEANPVFGPTRSRQSLLPFLDFLGTVHPAGSTDINHSLRDYALSRRRPGLAILITDLFAPGGYQDGLAHLQGRGYEVVLVHLLSPDELDPPLAGDLRLVDVETGAAQDVSLDPGLRDLYRKRVQTWRGEVQAFCRKRNIRYLGLTTSTPWEKVVLHEMRQASILK